MIEITTDNRMKIHCKIPSLKNVRGFCKNRFVGRARFLSDETYVRVLFYLRTGKFLHLTSPKTFNEKLQWLKLYAHKPQYSIMADKVRAKEFVAEKIGSNVIVPTLGVWESSDDIDFSTLPDKYVLKCNHNSGLGMFINKGDADVDENAVREGLRKGLEQDYYWPGRDKQYRDIPRRILAEQYLEDECQPSLIDYKVLCFSGKAKLIEVHMNRFTPSYTQDFYDENWNKLNIWQPGEPNSETIMAKPACFEDMVHFSERLSADVPHLRVDWYIIRGQLYFGEMTFFDAGGFLEFCPKEWNYILGDWITLPTIDLQ